jgi:hypothetical protein
VRCSAAEEAQQLEEGRVRRGVRQRPQRRLARRDATTWVHLVRRREGRVAPTVVCVYVYACMCMRVCVPGLRSGGRRERATTPRRIDLTCVSISRVKRRPRNLRAGGRRAGGRARRRHTRAGLRALTPRARTSHHITPAHTTASHDSLGVARGPQLPHGHAAEPRGQNGSHGAAVQRRGGGQRENARLRSRRAQKRGGARWSSLTECPLNARLETGVGLSFFLSFGAGQPERRNMTKGHALGAAAVVSAPGAPWLQHVMNVLTQHANKPFRMIEQCMGHTSGVMALRASLPAKSRTPRMICTTA